jgi:hypothetical protein
MSAKSLPVRAGAGETVIMAEIGLTNEEQITIRQHLGSDGAKYIRDQGANFELLSLSIMAAEDEMKEALRALQATPQFAKVKQLRLEIKGMKNMKQSAFQKSLGVFESAMRNIRKTDPLHKKILLLASTFKSEE